MCARGKSSLQFPLKKKNSVSKNGEDHTESSYRLPIQCPSWLIFYNTVVYLPKLKLRLAHDYQVNSRLYLDFTSFSLMFFFCSRI